METKPQSPHPSQTASLIKTRLSSALGSPKRLASLGKLHLVVRQPLYMAVNGPKFAMSSMQQSYLPVGRATLVSRGFFSLPCASRVSASSRRAKGFAITRRYALPIRANGTSGTGQFFTLSAMVTR